jgi:hypothetical protein
VAAATKVKDLLVGLPLTDEERRQVDGRPESLRDLVDTWMKTPQFERRLLAFFRQAFQQEQIGETELLPQLRGFINYNPLKNELMENLQSQFAMMALSWFKERQPFSQALTTRKFLMTVPMMVMYAAMDAIPVDDKGKASATDSWLLARYPNLEARTVPVPDAEATRVRDHLDPNGPEPFVFRVAQSKCGGRQEKGTISALTLIRSAMFGNPPGCSSAPHIFTPEERSTWRWVTIRPPRSGEQPTAFWDIGKLADPKTTELVLHTPRVGFMTTPAFFANWDTNESNDFRVTANQALIVALGRAFNDNEVAIPLADTAIDKEHAEPGTVCYGCHAPLDPMRDFFRLNFTIHYHYRPPRVRAGLPAKAGFSLEGSPARTGVDMEVLADALVKHPRFPIAWVQKLCVFANAKSCLEEDPEVTRIAKIFVDADFDFAVLARELFSSPLVTFSRPTLTAERQGIAMGIARRELMCERILNRMDVASGCKGTPQVHRVKPLADGIPGSSFARGANDAVVPSEPAMFSTLAQERVCEEIAGLAIASNQRLDPKDPEIVLDRLASEVMGLWREDPRWGPVRAALARHYQAGVAESTSRNESLRRTDALKRTFVVACASAPAAAVGF